MKNYGLQHFRTYCTDKRKPFSMETFYSKIMTIKINNN